MLLMEKFAGILDASYRILSLKKGGKSEGKDTSLQQ